MKRIIIALVLILICLAASMTEVFFISRNVTAYCDDIEQIDTSMRKDDFEQERPLEQNRVEGGRSPDSRLRGRRGAESRTDAALYRKRKPRFVLCGE